MGNSNVTTHPYSSILSQVGNKLYRQHYLHVYTTSAVWIFENYCVVHYHEQWAQELYVTPICVGNLTIIGSDNGLSPGRRQAIIWTNAWILLIAPLVTNLSEILIMHYHSRKSTWKYRLEKAVILPRHRCVNTEEIRIQKRKWISSRFKESGYRKKNQSKTEVLVPRLRLWKREYMGILIVVLKYHFKIKKQIKRRCLYIKMYR